MKYTIRLTTENSFAIDSVAESYADLVEEIKLASTFPLPASFKLIYNGEKLSGVLGLPQLPDEANIILMEELKPKKKKNRCSFGSCNNTYLKLVGSCQHCGGNYCAKHRLLEDHICKGLQYCKDTAHEQNALKLESERTISSKV